MITRDQFLGLTARRYRQLTIAGHDYRIRALTDGEKSDFEASVLTSEGKFSTTKIKRQRRKLICLCLVDDEGNLLLNPADESLLEHLDGAITSRLYDECRKHCGFEEGDLEELVKNSEGNRGASSLAA